MFQLLLPSNSQGTMRNFRIIGGVSTNDVPQAKFGTNYKQHGTQIMEGATKYPSSQPTRTPECL
jgi:hypothetical protein